MNSLIFVVAVGIAVIALLLIAFRRPGKRAKAKRIQKSISADRASERESTQWRAVKISPGLLCCEASAKLADQVFLARESPRLPLDGCTESGCKCKYLHLEDRRSGDDRRVELGELGAFLPVNQIERRQLSGRRATDLAA